MECPRCNEKMVWQSDYSCHEVSDCPCDNGIVSYYSCDGCNVKVELTTDCKGDNYDDE